VGKLLGPGRCGTFSAFVAMPTAVTAPLLAASLLLAAACGRSERDPESVLRSFLSAAARGDGAVALDLLAQGTATAWQTRLETARQAAGIAGPVTREAVVAALDVRLTRGIDTVKVATNDGARALVDVVDHQGRSERFTLVREGELWRVVLPAPK
jgi:hypothetical protein